MKFFFKLLPFFLCIFLFPCVQPLTDPSILVSPTIIPAIKQQIGHQAPNGFGPKLIQSTRIYKSFPDCACMAQIPNQCPPCTGTPSNEVYRQVLMISQCECAPRMQCDPCPRLYQAVHEMSLRQASFDLNAQAALQQKAQDQAKLYGEAQRYALEMQQQEKKALEAAKLMNEAAAKADIARQRMLKANAKAREIAESSLGMFSGGGGNFGGGFLSANPPFDPYAAQVAPRNWRYQQTNNEGNSENSNSNNNNNNSNAQNQEIQQQSDNDENNQGNIEENNNNNNSEQQQTVEQYGFREDPAVGGEEGGNDGFLDFQDDTPTV